jgi:histone acetyltransferase (RNA polymerase elongator complex component)
MPRIKCHDDASIDITPNGKDTIKIEMFVRGGRFFCNLSTSKVQMLIKTILNASDEAKSISEGMNEDENKY